MKIFLGTDHAGYELKEKLKVFLGELGYEVEDRGAFAFDAEDDYPDFVAAVARAVSEHRGNAEKVRGILLGGSGQGEAMAANRFPHVRAAVYYGGGEKSGADFGNIINLSREHNDANVLSLGARFLSEEEAKQAVKQWLTTPFSGDGRHKRRLEKMEKLTQRL